MLHVPCVPVSVWPWAGVPVIVLSAHAGGQRTAQELAVAEFLPKPIRLDALMAAVRRHGA